MCTLDIANCALDVIYKCIQCLFCLTPTLSKLVRNQILLYDDNIEILM